MSGGGLGGCAGCESGVWLGAGHGVWLGRVWSMAMGVAGGGLGV